MRTLKSIGLFFVWAVLFLAIGFGGGMLFRIGEREQTPPFEGRTEPTPEPEKESSLARQEFAGFVDVSTLSGILGRDTQYVLEETDVLRGTVIETIVRLPEMYVGMDRESFQAAMKQYESAPPLSERKRGFESLEVISFSRERVVVRMNYRYVQPGESFYLALQDHEIVVLLEDRKTVYIETGISADVLPQELQAELIDMVFVEDEASLYDLLEAYSS